MVVRDPLFSSHIGLDGSIHLYLEEQDANLDLVENIVTEIPEIHLKALKESAGVDSLKTMEAVRRADFARSRVPDLATLIVRMSEAETLDLVENLLLSVRHARAIANKQTKISLRLVK